MYVYGKNVIRELLKSNTKIYEVFIAKNFDDKDIFNIIKEKRIKFSIKEKKYVDQLVDAFSQGIVAKIDEYNYKTLDYILREASNKEYPFIMILDQITDVNNFASIIRVCECVGVDGIIIPNNRSAEVNASVYKISSGALFNVNVCKVANIASAMKKLKDEGYWIVGTDLNTDYDYTDVDYKMKVGLVIGSEGKGIRENTRKNCDFLVKIPMVGEINSLNASVAAGILSYQIFNNRRER